MSCHDIGRGLNEVTRVVLKEYDEGRIPYEPTFRILKQCKKSVHWCDGNEGEAVVCMYDRCSRCFKKEIPLFEMRWIYNNRELIDLMDEKALGWHLCQGCIDKLEIQEYVDGPWDVEEQSRYDY